MRLKTFAAAAATALGLAAAAPAMALTLTFNVNVTSATGVDNFTPFSFQETWTYSPTDTVNPGVLSSPLPGIIPETRHEQETFSGSPASTAGSPLTAGLLGIAGFSTVDGGVSHVDYSRNTTFDETDTQTSSNSLVEFFSSRTVNTLQDAQDPTTPLDDIYLLQNYSQSIEGSGNASQTPGSMSDAAFIAYLAGLGPLQWSESASQSVGGIYWGGPPMVSLGSADYSGTATLVMSPSAAPEPGAWGLMLLGFGGAGAILRRQRTALAV